MDACGDVGPTHVVGGCVRPMLCIQRQRMSRLRCEDPGGEQSFSLFFSIHII
jgi:hypothetical protein